MSWLDELLTGLQNGSTPQVGALGASPFPDVSQNPAVDEAAVAAAAREAAGQRLIRSNQRRIDPFAFPDQNSAGVQLAMDNAPAGTGVPTSAPFAMGVPPSFQLASSMTGAPPQGQQPPPLPPAQDVVPLPQPRPIEADQPPVTDVSAARRAPLGMTGPAPAVAAAAPAPTPDDPSLLSSLNNGLKSFADPLRGFAAALGGDGGATTQAILKQREDKALQLQSANLTANALLKKGAPAEDVAAAVRSPELLKALVQQYYGKDKYSVVQTGESESEFGGKSKTYRLFNANDGTFKDIAANSEADARTQAAGTPPSGGNGYLAPGVTTADHALVGDDYLKQFAPEVQQSVKDYLGGRTTPVGNPRKGWAENIKKIAQKYGGDIGVPADDTSFVQRKTFANSLGNTNTGVGMQAKGFQQGLSHFSELADSLEKSNPSNGMGLAPLAHGVNAVRGLSTSQGDIRSQIDAKAQALAGELGKLYSGSSGGGVHERQATKDLFGKNLSGPEMAGALEATLELMQGGLNSLQQRRDELFPTGNYPKGANFVGDAQQKQMDHIREVIDRLRGGSAAPSAKPVTSGKTSSGISWRVN